MFSGPMPMAEFRQRIWDQGFGGGDPLRDIAPGLERSLIGVIETGDFRRKKPFWANRDAAAPCTFYCPIHIPTIDRLRMIREGRNRRGLRDAAALHPVSGLGLRHHLPQSLHPELLAREDRLLHRCLGPRALGAGRSNRPEALPATGKKVAIIGGGPAGMAVAWHLALNGVEAHIFERDNQLGGKLAQTIPWERLSQAVWDVEVDRFLKTKNLHVNLGVQLSKDKVEELQKAVRLCCCGCGYPPAAHPVFSRSRTGYSRTRLPQSCQERQTHAHRQAGGHHRGRQRRL